MKQAFLEGEGICQRKEWKGIAYLFEKEEIFSQTDYLILQNTEKEKISGGLEGVMVPCAKVQENGKNELVYITEGLLRIDRQDRIPDEQTVLHYGKSFLEAVLKIKKNGFLHVQNLDLRIDRLFYDSQGKTIRLIYLPLAEEYGQPETDAVLQKEICQILRQILRLSGTGSGSVLLAMKKRMDTGNHSLEEMDRFLQQHLSEEGMGAEMPAPAPESPEHGQRTKQLVLTEIGSDHPDRFYIGTEEYIIGKRADMANGVIAGNSAISRKHCKIIYLHGQYYVVDLQSLNGTYVNGIRAKADAPQELHHGDVLKLADTGFNVQM